MASNTLDTAIADSPLPSQQVGAPLPRGTPPVAPEDDATLTSTSASTRAAHVTYSGLSKDSITYRAVKSFRDQFRAESIPASYSPWDHLGSITVWGSGAALLACWLAGGPIAILKSPASLAMAVLAFGFANFFEWWSHKNKLHNPLVHTRHSHTHHRFYTDKVMEYDEFRDAHTIFFPPRAAPFLMGALPILALLPSLLFGLAAGATFACTLATYYVTYEWLHLAYHCPPDSFLGSLPGVAYLRHHHQVHHAQSLMNRYNFNITFPIADWIFGTTYKESAAKPAQQTR